MPRAKTKRPDRARLGLALAGAIALASLAAQGARADSADPRDFEGYWVVKLEGPPMPPGAGPPPLPDLPYKPETRAIVARRADLVRQLKPVVGTHLGCRPPGGREVLNALSGAVVVQNAARLVLLSQEDRGTWSVQIDRSHSAQPRPSYMGESVAQWEGDTLVVDSIGYNGRAEITQSLLGTSSPLSEQAHIVTRVSKSADNKVMIFASTYTDPIHYTAPFDVTVQLERRDERHLMDYDCAETPRADEFARWTFDDDWYRPTCTFPVSNGLMGDKIVCTPPPRRRR